ncbi:uncharacterized protein LOC126883303 isoform X2 [Diabrotica virgifera virgifera]|uniref:Uncharacterized protein LOC114334264 isoform X2 n=1 Tax=Diabrotica virgifera virgifera TaxID=50390 RepID=A0A6P7FUI7_DIAVI|nr:uncharacterized protein LOC126883303 isoform X2 [Diabrotica virgifera virgifera]
MQLWSNLVIVCMLVLAFTANIAVSTSNSTNPPKNDQDITNSTASVNTSTTTKENTTQKSTLNTTIYETTSNVNNTININSTTLNGTNLETTTSHFDMEDIKATNSSNFYYSMVPPEKKSNNSQIDTEVEDLLNVPDYDLVQTANDPDNRPAIFLNDDSINVESIHTDGQDDEPVPEHKGLVPGKVAAILAGVFVAFAIVGYIALMSWRRYLENRYGNREMLVEDDYCEKQMNDLEHFSI